MSKYKDIEVVILYNDNGEDIEEIIQSSFEKFLTKEHIS